MEKKSEYWTIKEIIDLRDKLYPLLGWRGDSNLDLVTTFEKTNDLILFMKANKKYFGRRSKKKLLKILKPELIGFDYGLYWDDEKDKWDLTIFLSKGTEDEQE